MGVASLVDAQKLNNYGHWHLHKEAEVGSSEYSAQA